MNVTLPAIVMHVVTEPACSWLILFDASITDYGATDVVKLDYMYMYMYIYIFTKNTSNQLHVYDYFHYQLILLDGGFAHLSRCIL